MKSSSSVSKHATMMRQASSFAPHAQLATQITRYVCLRVIRLGDTPVDVPCAMSSVRDGLLVVAMPSEMRVYAQWGLMVYAPHTHDSHDHDDGVSALALRPSMSSAITPDALHAHMPNTVRYDEHMMNRCVHRCHCMCPRQCPCSTPSRPPRPRHPCAILVS